LRIGWVELESLLKGIFGTDQIAYAMLSCTLATPSLCPVWLDLGGLVGVLESFLVLLERSIGAGAVGVQYMI
jgi:hypothetical protein